MSAPENNVTLRVDSITDLSFNLTELLEYTNHTIVVYAFTDKGQGEGSEPIVIRTSEHSKIPIVNNVCVMDDSESMLQVSIGVHYS